MSSKTGPTDGEYASDLRILRRFVYSGSFGFRQSDDEVFQRLKARYPEAYAAFGEERKQGALEANAHSPYIEGQRRTYPNNPDKDVYIRRLERLKHLMVLSKLGYGSREMAMALVNSKRQYPEAAAAFEGELANL